MNHDFAHLPPQQCVVRYPDLVSAGHRQGPGKSLRALIVGNFRDDRRVAYLVHRGLWSQGKPLQVEHRLFEFGHRSADGVGVHNRQAKDGCRVEGIGHARTAKLTCDHGVERPPEILAQSLHGQDDRMLFRPRDARVRILRTAGESSHAVRAADQGFLGKLTWVTRVTKRPAS